MKKTSPGENMKIKIRVTDRMIQVAAQAAYDVELDGEPHGSRRATWDEADPAIRRVHLIQARAGLTAALDAR